MLSCHPDLNSNCTPEQKQHLNNVQIILDILSKLDITKPVISSKPLALMPAQKLLTEEHETILRQNIKELIRYYNELINLFNNLYTHHSKFYVKMNELIKSDKFENLEPINMKPISEDTVDKIKSPADGNYLISLIYLGQQLAILVKQINTDLKEFIDSYKDLISK